MGTETPSNNKRIAKNTALLYVRMAITMLIALYTSRVVLRTLGVTDYGIYNVVGGVVAMFGFLNGAMSSATQRYITFALGRGDRERLRTVFVTSVNIHAVISALVLLLAESIGLWFLYTQMQVPPERMDAAFWVFQCSMTAMVVMIMSVPYNAAIIAHEQMSAFAYISIADVILKLLIVYLLTVIPFDHLKTYAVLILSVQLFIRWLYTCYCSRHFPETHYRRQWDKPLMREMFSFAGWSLWGNIAGMLFTQGVNMLLNVFFGPTVNAARAVAVQVQGAITQFAGNFQTALNPQITKTYAAGEMKQMHRLIYASAKFSAYLLLVLAIPILIETPYILRLWLGEYPGHTESFIRIILTISIFDATTQSLIIANQATGRVKTYQAVVGGILLLIVPISYVALKLGGSPETVFIVHFGVSVSAQVVRLLFMRAYIHLSMRKYVFGVYIPILLSTVCAMVLPVIIHYTLPDSFFRMTAVVVTSLVCSAVSLYYIGLDKSERGYVIQIKDKMFKRNKWTHHNE